MSYACVYCGKPVNDGCPHPNVFACCGKVGHAEEVTIDEETPDAGSNQANQ